MTDKGVLHARTARALEGFLQNPTQSVVLTGPVGIGKDFIINWLAEKLLQASEAELHNHAYFKYFATSEGIESVRDLQRFVTLRVVASSAEKTINRIAVIENAHQLGAEAQNALLKTLEEPPSNTLIILTADQIESLLPTVRSRTNVIPVYPPIAKDLRTFLLDAGFQATSIDQVMRLSGGLPGLAIALLEDDKNHPLYAATEQARQIVRASTFERLTMVDGLGKQKEQALLVLTMMSRMAQAALQQLATSSDATASNRMSSWETMLAATNKAESQLRANAQTKLTLTSLMLSL